MAASQPTPGASSQDSETTKPGPPNPQGTGGSDVPSPPGGPLRSDAPAGTVAPGGPGTPGMPGEPQVVQRARRPVTEPGSDVDPAPELLRGADNAQSSQEEPSDHSGSE